MGVATRIFPDGSVVSRHHPVGASTGYMRGLRGDWPGQIDAALQVSPFAVELSALSEDELPSLARFLADAAGSLPFRYVSIHGPSKGRRIDEAELVAELAHLAGEHGRKEALRPNTSRAGGDLLRAPGGWFLFRRRPCLVGSIPRWRLRLNSWTASAVDCGMFISAPFLRISITGR
jgi:hypothetical protein